eukprot:scaffold1090_cov265-Pinguiococcus_pyrenoidosus.AAC.14
MASEALLTGYMLRGRGRQEAVLFAVLHELRAAWVYCIHENAKSLPHRATDGRGLEVLPPRSPFRLRALHSADKSTEILHDFLFPKVDLPNRRTDFRRFLRSESHFSLQGAQGSVSLCAASRIRTRQHGTSFPVPWGSDTVPRTIWSAFRGSTFMTNAISTLSTNFRGLSCAPLSTYGKGGKGGKGCEV